MIIENFWKQYLFTWIIWIFAPKIVIFVKVQNFDDFLRENSQSNRNECKRITIINWFLARKFKFTILLLFSKNWIFGHYLRFWKWIFTPFFSFISEKCETTSRKTFQISSRKRRSIRRRNQPDHFPIRKLIPPIIVPYWFCFLSTSSNDFLSVEFGCTIILEIQRFTVIISSKTFAGSTT